MDTNKYLNRWWNDSTKFLHVNDYAYSRNRQKVDAWLTQKNMMEGFGIYALRKIGPLSICYRYATPRRLSRWGGTVRAARAVPKIVWGYPL